MLTKLSLFSRIWNFFFRREAPDRSLLNQLLSVERVKQKSNANYTIKEEVEKRYKVFQKQSLKKYKEELKELISKAEVKGLTVYSVIDEGRTEFKGIKTLTCAAFGPNKSEDIDAITGHLNLL